MPSDRNLVLTCCFFLAACSQPQAANETGHIDSMRIDSAKGAAQTVRPGEYLLAVSGTIEQSQLFGLLAEFEPLSLSRAGSYYLLRIARDPGLSAIRFQCSKLPGFVSVQPNFSYRLPTLR